MTELISTLGGLIASLGNVQSAAVLKERLALAQDQLAAVKQHVEQLEHTNAQLVDRCTKAEQQLARQAEAQNLKKHMGALFKPRPDGGYESSVSCPKCGGDMWSMDIFPYTCTTKGCGHMADFSKMELPEVLRALR